MKRILFLATLIFVSSAQAFTLSSAEVGWKGNKLKVNVNPTNCPSDIIDSVTKAAAIWNSVTTSGLELVVGDTSSSVTASALYNVTADPSQTPVIICDTAFAATTGSSANSVAGVGFASSNGFYFYIGGMLLNVQAGGTANINNASKAQRDLIVAHEMGHMLGIGHSQEAAALMYYSLTSKTQPILHQDDWDAMTYLYPRDELQNGFMGCGLVQNQNIKPGSSLLLLSLIGFVYLFLRFSRSTRTIPVG